jgi:hypothetical protein
VLRVGYLKRAGVGWQLHLNKTPENVAFLDLAINLLRTGSLAGMEVSQQARIALTKGEQYIQSLISASELKKRPRQIKDERAAHECRACATPSRECQVESYGGTLVWRFREWC